MTKISKTGTTTIATIMGQKHQQVHNNTCREHRESIRDDEDPANHISTRVIVGNSICEDMISQSSLLRSDRFARSKPIVVVACQGEETARISDQARDREGNTNSSACGGLCQEINSPMIEAVNRVHRRGRAIVSADSGGVNGVTKRGKAPTKVRPVTTAGTTSKVRSTLDQLKSSEQDGGNHFPPCEVTTSRQKLNGVGSFSNIPALVTDFDAPPLNKVHSRGQISSSPSVGSDITELSSHRARLSQSPLSSASTAFTSLSEEYFRLSPMRSKPAVGRISPDQMPRKVSQQLGPSSHLDDEWSSRCFKLTQQIVENLQSWSQSSSSDGQISVSPIMSRQQYSSKSSISRDWMKGTQTLSDQQSTSVDRCALARTIAFNSEVRLS